MPIPVKNNTRYEGSHISTKYAPLDVNAVPIDDGAQTEYVNLFQGRIDLLRNQNLLPAQLNLYAANWDLIQANETAAAALPPIIVISSNRAEWIQEIYDRCNEIQAGNYNNVNDTAALQAGATPWYHPKRINNPNRHVYIVVHKQEYEHYKDCLKNTLMTVVGWSFDSNRVKLLGSWIEKSYVGFGASRFAALEFCKYIFNHPIVNGAAVPPVPIARQKAWLVDDNLVYVRAFPDFEAVEAVMTDAIWGLGFTATTKNSAFKELNELIVQPAANLGALKSTGLLQQCVLWNIHQLNAEFLNFSPYFLNSNEDTSLSNYLQKLPDSKLRICTGATVFKGSPKDGESFGAKSLLWLRNRAAQNFYYLERNYQVDTGQSQDRQQAFSNYVIHHILPNAIEYMRNENPIFTEAKAVEQIMAKVVADKINWVPERVFHPNGDARQLTQHF